jgi:hypothetical protein
MKGYSKRSMLQLPPIAAAYACLFALLLGPIGSASVRADEPDKAIPPPADDAAATPEAAQPLAAAAPPVDPAALAAWIQELDDDRYAVREQAQKQLAAAGSAALEAVGQLAVAGSLESSTRAVAVLLRWADSKDPALSLAALERLAALTSRPTEAAMAADRLAEVRQVAAVAAIKSLGGRFDFDTSGGMVIGPHAPVQVIIDPNWKGGVEGLRHVAAVRSATKLSLYSAPLDDAAVEELAKVTQVKRMEIFGAGLSPEGVAKLKEKLPGTFFDVRSGARLGIRGPLVIDHVFAGSPAEKAGLRRQDKIIEFAGKPITDFDQLTAEIATCKPGDTKSLKALRPDPTTGQAATVELSVTFDRWGDDQQSLSGSQGSADPFGQPQRLPAQPGVQRTIIIQGGRIQAIQGPVPPARPRDK